MLHTLKPLTKYNVYPYYIDYSTLEILDASLERKLLDIVQLFSLF